MFEPTSRYYAIETATLRVRDEEGRERPLLYKRRRFVPSAGRGTVAAEHAVTQGERLDVLTARYLGDPTQFWRVCDANGVFRPAELEEVGRVIVIALPDA